MNKISLKIMERVTHILIYLIIALAISSCDSNDVDNMFSDLSNVDWDQVDELVVLNNEIINGASIEFVEVPDSDALVLKLHGVHPYETIEMEVTAARDKQGNILFQGEHAIEDIRSINVNGIYIPTQMAEGMNTAKSSAKINISYTVPSPLLEMSHTIPFNEDSGFCYIPDEGTYPLATVDVEAQRDSCRFICKQINSEIGKNLMLLNFKFDNQGKMRLSLVTTNYQEYSKEFRYWISKGKLTNKKYIEIENADSFYESIFNTIGLDMNQSNYEFSYNVAHLYIEERQRKPKSRIVILDKIHNEIFIDFYRFFSECGIWTENEKKYIDLMRNKCNWSYSTPGHIVDFEYYRWAFENYDN